MRLIGLVVVLMVCLILAPVAIEAQPAAVPAVGVLSSASAELFAPFVAAFRDGLNDAGYIEGRNVTIEFAWAAGRYDRLPTLAEGLVARKVAVIFAHGGAVAALAAKAATSTIPIVIAIGDDPVKFGLVSSLGQPEGNITGVTHFMNVLTPKRLELLTEQAGGDLPIVMAGVGDAVRYGLVASLAHPGGNVTGITLITQDVTAKALELLKEVVPQRKHIGFLWNAGLPFSDVILGEAQAAGIHLGLTLRPLEIRRPEDVEPVFAEARRERIDTLLVRADPLTLVNRQQIVTLAAQHKVIAMYSAGEFVRAGGLMSYAVPLTATFRGAAMYLDKILRGGKPADLPVEQPTKFELIINLKTAKALGLTIPQTLLLRADQLIE